jgi:tetratricopeptide (TPR) repeat protein
VSRARHTRRVVTIGYGFVALSRGDLGEARRLADEALAILRVLDPRSILNMGLQLGRVALAQGDYARAEAVFRSMIDVAHEIGERFKLSDPWLGLAAAVRARDDLAGARSCFRELVSELRAASCGHLLPRVLLGLAMLEAGAGHDLKAARLLGAFDAADVTTMGWALEGYCLGPDLATLRARVEQKPFVAALLEGRRLTVDEALNDALARGEAGGSTPPSKDVYGLADIYVASLFSSSVSRSATGSCGDARPHGRLARSSGVWWPIGFQIRTDPAAI